jgi:hypothetical protein
LTYDREDDKSGEGSQTYLTGDKVENGEFYTIMAEEGELKAIGYSPL